MTDRRKFINDKLSLVPELPGIYQMKNKDDLIIYVGKSKNLKKRLKSYFTKSLTGKTMLLVNDIYNFDYVVTKNELEALILELNLIKKYVPKYNILLKDDKSYPYIELTDEEYPMLKVVRNIKRNKKKTTYFGPFPNVTAARRTVDILNRIYPLRKCKVMGRDLCLYYHIGECLGYCRKEIVDVKSMNEMRSEIVSFLNGNKSFIVSKIEEQMNKASEEMNYEKALNLKQMLEDINITLTKQTIDLNRNYNLDVFGYYQNNNYLSVFILFIRKGILFGHHKEIVNIIDEKEEEIIEYIIKYYEKGNLLPKEIIVNKNIDIDLLEQYLEVKVAIPQKGNIKKILETANTNARNNLEEREELLKKDDKIKEDAKNELERLLNIDKINKIEAFDNSHLFGTFYVGAMVVFNDFEPNKKEYRKYKISTSVPDDLEAMREVIYRRYFKVLMENLEKPDLIIVDGGKTQVNVALEVIESLGMNLKVIGLKKDNKHKTNSIIDSNLSEIPINNHSSLFLFLGKIQEEVHRFAITYHRNSKSKGLLSSMLDAIPGVGEVTKKELLKKLGSLKKLKEASIEELETVLNKKVAKELFDYLKNVDS